ncbi:MAG: UDP-N-acetylglucosamine 2-epimerase (non-hydrolyzing), partial [Nannocystaceae bacterium]|nr:UDP-N-acetylglucosamine 2-epimerase (non-hydrolyzing) [Nannocystaceae bacterium]
APDFDLDVMEADQSPTDVLAEVLQHLQPVLQKVKPDWLLVQGDTTTTFCGALAASYHRIPVAHVEAGLRTYDRGHPFPEEANRCLTGQISDFHFAPTEGSKANLLREGISADKIWVTGNTAIDALQYTLAKAGDREAKVVTGRQILVTAHRRENHGEPLAEICRALLRLVERFDDLTVRFPVHLSPRVRKTVFGMLEGHDRIILEEPLGYDQFIAAMSDATVILSDSGGVQEEAPSLGKPVLVLRETTERPDACEAGCAMLVGTDGEKIFRETERLLTDDAHYQSMARVENPFGNGTAGEQIIRVLAEQLG